MFHSVAAALQSILFRVFFLNYDFQILLYFLCSCPLNKTKRTTTGTSRKERKKERKKERVDTVGICLLYSVSVRPMLLYNCTLNAFEKKNKSSTFRSVYSFYPMLCSVFFIAAVSLVKETQ